MPSPEASAAPTPATAPPSTFRHSIRVRYVECDPMRVAHHSSCIAWLEEARTEMLRGSGVSYAQLEAAGVFLVVASLEVGYRRPIRYDDVIAIEVEASAMGRARLRHDYRLVLLERDGAAPDAQSDPSVPLDGVCVRATTVLACVGADGRPRPMPGWLAGAEA